MPIEQIVDVPESGQLTIQLPPSLHDRKKLKVTIEDIENTLESKIALLQKAGQDQDFLADLTEVNKDFELAESSVEFH